MKRRTYDGYIASAVREEIGRVFFIGSNRVVVKKEFTRVDWDAERELASKTEGAERSKGPVVAGIHGPGQTPAFNNSSAPPADKKFFYGVDYV